MIQIFPFIYIFEEIIRSSYTKNNSANIKISE